MHYHRFLLLSLIALTISHAARGEDAKINTPVRTAELRDTWELQTEDPATFRQTLHLGPGLTGQWKQSRPSHPVTLAWFVEGNELRLLHYYEPDQPFNYRVKTLMVPYALSGDSLTLTLDGKRTVWKRLRQQAAATP